MHTERHVRVIYNPDSPDQALLVDLLPGSPKIDGQGQVAPSIFHAVLTLVPPVLVLVVLALLI